MMNFVEMTYTELSSELVVTDISITEAEIEKDEKRKNDMISRKNEIMNELEKREKISWEEEAEEEREAIDALIENVFEEDNRENFNNVIEELRREGVDFIPYESNDGRIRHITILWHGKDIFRMMIVEFQSGKIFNHISIGGKPGKAYTTTARSLALKAAQFQRK